MTELKGFAAKLDGIANDLSAQGMKKALEQVGEKGVDIADRAVKNDIGDMSMSGWRRGNPFNIASDAKPLGDSGVEIAPQRKVRGPMRVLEEGRRSYVAGDRRQSGVRTRKSDGAVMAKTRRVKRNTSATSGKQTWSDATAVMEKQLPIIVRDAVRESLGKRFKG